MNKIIKSIILILSGVSFTSFIYMFYMFIKILGEI